MRLDVTIFEKSYAAFPENIEIIPDVLPVHIPPGGKDASVGADRNSQLNSRPRSEGWFPEETKPLLMLRGYSESTRPPCVGSSRGSQLHPSRRPSMPSNVDGTTPFNVQSDKHDSNERGEPAENGGSPIALYLAKPEVIFRKIWATPLDDQLHSLLE